MALCLNQVTIIVEDFDLYKSFFTRLGLKLIVDAAPRYARFECPGNAATFSIEKTDDAAPLGLNQSQLFFELPSKQELDDYCKTLEEKGFRFKEKQHERDKEYLWREAHLITPENHDIRLYFAGENRLNPPWRVNPSEVEEQQSASKKLKQDEETQ